MTVTTRFINTSLEGWSGIATIILHVLGVSPVVLEQDYMLSNQCIDPAKEKSMPPIFRTGAKGGRHDR